MDKPTGRTSHDVVALARRTLGLRAVGHTGTLDPFATGLLVLLTGRATRLARFVERQPKTYLATARLGWSTSTDDRTGQPLGAPAAAMPEPEEVAAALGALMGRQWQRPPAFSAKKVAGERSYRRARRGEAVELAPVEVEVYRVELLSWSAPDLVFRTVVSPGTYVRALARDLGERLGTGAHLTALRREAIGSLAVADALPLEALGPATPLLPPAAVLRDLPAVELDAGERRDVGHGRAVRRESPAGDTALLWEGALVAVARSEDGWLRPLVVLGDA